tara:strand:+ start:2959 stop:4155 length:1197 start_codon:yes stop_codon:yes gene_type:complete
MNCKITNTKITPFMSFGKMPIANGFINKKNFKKEYFYKMEVGFSKKISLVQLINHPKPKQMFNKNYPFFTSSSKEMIVHFKKYSNWIKKKFSKKIVNLVEIGSNDGTFLSNFKNTNVNVLGIEPSSNVAKISSKKGINTINKFFNFNNIKKLNKLKKNVDVICGANVICHIPDLKSLIKGVDYLLAKKGVFIFEEPYLGSMYKKTSYDQIYDEHIYLFSVSSIKKIFEIFGFDLIDALPQKTHGGSMRYVIGKKNENKISKNVKKILKKERQNNIDNIKGCLKFKQNCEKSKHNLINKLNLIKSKGKKIAGYAATSKSTTVLNYCKIGPKLIDFICDTTKNKIGKFSPGTHIPIKSMNYFYKNIPDVAYLFAWNHRNEIFKKEKKLKNKIKWISHVKI